MEIIQLPALQDNYAYLVHDEASGKTAAIDTPSAEVLRKELTKRGWRLDAIFNTHHHRDHVGSNLALKEEFGSVIYGSKKDRARIPGLDKELSDGDEFYFGREKVQVFAADGHTRGHIVYYMPSSNALFCGDVIFSLGCGKLFEGTAEEMWRTLSRLRELPTDTLVYCAHEYTLENAMFALQAEPGNQALHARILEVKDLREKGLPTVPTSLGQEKATNPFLRPESAEIQKNVGAIGLSLPAIFGATRATKDEFDSRQ